MVLRKGVNVVLPHCHFGGWDIIKSNTANANPPFIPTDRRDRHLDFGDRLRSVGGQPIRPALPERRQSIRHRPILRSGGGKLGRPPANADELKPFLPAGSDINQLLTSPNDGQPYVVVWGTKLSSTPDQYLIVAYERVGSNGYRVVLCPAGTRTLAEADFAKSTFPPGHKPGG